VHGGAGLCHARDLQLILEKLADNDIEIDHLIRRHAA
jgi:hypothetical protein